MNGRNLVARKAGRVSMESLTSNRMTVNASKMMNSGKLIEFYHIICTIIKLWGDSDVGDNVILVIL